MLYPFFGIRPRHPLKTTFSVTHTTDTALATRASGGSQIGLTLNNKTIPTSGVIRVTILEGEFDETDNLADGRVAVALDVGGTKIWATSDDAAGAAIDMGFRVSQNVASRLIGAGVDGQDSIENTALVFSFDIAAHSFPTGSRDVRIYMGDNANSKTGEVTLTGTTVTCRLLVEIVDTT